jgi:hypothetical protein
MNPLQKSLFQASQFLKSANIFGQAKSQPKFNNGLKSISSYAGLQNYQKSLLDNFVNGEDLKAKAKAEFEGKPISKIGTQNGNVYKLAPAWYLYEKMYEIIPSVGAGVNKKANAISKLASSFYFKNGQINQELTDEINKNFHYKKLKIQASKQLDIFGTLIVGKFPTYSKDKLPIFKMIPASQTQNFIVNKYANTIEQLSWAENDVYDYQQINRLEIENGEVVDHNFYVYTDPDISDQFFGVPRLQSLYTTLDMKLRDDQNYELFLKNASFPGVIALVGGDQQDIVEGELEAYFRSLRDADTRFKASTIKNGLGENGPTVQFTTFKQSIENRLSLVEKREIDGSVFDNLFIPRTLMGMPSVGGFDSGYEEQMVIYKENCIDPQVEQIMDVFQNYIVPETLDALAEDGYFEEKKFKFEIDGKEVIVDNENYKDSFYFATDSMSIDTPAMRRTQGRLDVQAGIITKKEYKLNDLGYKEQDLNEDDDAYLLPNNISVVKAGNLIEGNAEDQTDDNVKEDIADKEPKPETNPASKDVEMNDPQDVVKSAIFEKKTFNIEDLNELVRIEALRVKTGKFKAKANKLFSKTDDNFSKVPNILATTKAKELKAEIKKVLDKQYKGFEWQKLLKQPFVLEFQNYLKQNPKPLASDKVVKDYKTKLLAYTKLNLPKLELQPKELASSLMFFGKLGQDDMVLQAKKAGKADLDEKQKKEVGQKLFNYVLARTENLVNGKPKSKAKSLFDPNFNGQLDDKTEEEIMAILYALSLDYGYSEEDLQNEYDNLVEQRTENRAELISQDNIIRAFMIGFLSTGDEYSVQKYQWLRTNAAKPDSKHLAQVGIVSSLEKGWPSGDLPGQRFGCQCGLKPVFSLA